MTHGPIKLGVIGGSGIYQIEGANLVATHELETTFGHPSDVISEVAIDGRSVFFLPRHGRGHRYLPSEVNYRANILALKMLGVTHVLAVSAVGIMREDITPGDMVVPDQIFDRTKGVRESSFFGDGVVGHVSFADPFCSELRSLILSAAKEQGAKVHDGGTYICMEGPQFSTRAESHFYRKTLAPSVIGMTALPEAKLAREAELSYAMLALATDYDCWNEKAEDVSVEAVMKVLANNAALAKAIVTRIAQILPDTSTSPWLTAAAQAIMTPVDQIPSDTLGRLEPLYGRYLHRK